MKLLLDSGVGHTVREGLRATGYDVSAVIEWVHDPGDDEILKTAYDEQRVVITIDRDFGELVVRHGRPCHGLIRLVGLSVTNQLSLCQTTLKRYAGDLLNGSILTIEPGRIRIRRANG